MAAVTSPVNPGAGFVTTAPSPLATIKGVTNTISTLFLFGAVIYLILAGYMYLSAGGDEKKLGVAKNNFIYGVIGIAIALLAYSLPGVIGTYIGGGAELQ